MNSLRVTISLSIISTSRSHHAAITVDHEHDHPQVGQPAPSELVLASAIKMGLHKMPHPLCAGLRQEQAKKTLELSHGLSVMRRRRRRDKNTSKTKSKLIPLDAESVPVESQIRFHTQSRIVPMFDTQMLWQKMYDWIDSCAVLCFHMETLTVTCVCAYGSPI